MDRSKTRRLDEVIREYIERMPAATRYREMSLVSRWEEVVGRTVARHTSRIRIRKGRMIVELDSSIVRNELFMIREGLVARLNEMAGEELIREIILK